MGRRGCGQVQGPPMQGPPSSRQEKKLKLTFQLQSVKLLTELQILGCELHKMRLAAGLRPDPLGEL